MGYFQVLHNVTMYNYLQAASAKDIHSMNLIHAMSVISPGIRDERIAYPLILRGRSIAVTHLPTIPWGWSIAMQ